MQTNRQARRALRAQAAGTAATLAKSAYDYSDGQITAYPGFPAINEKGGRA